VTVFGVGRIKGKEQTTANKNIAASGAGR